jgi:hypothetical protein
LPSARVHRTWRTSAALRPVVAVLLIVLMASNVVAGSFSGFLHIHIYEHTGHHHHHHGDDHHHHNDGASGDDAGATEVLLPDVRDEGPAGSADDKWQGKLHDHGPIVTLGLVKTAEWAHEFARSLWNPAREAQLVPANHGPSERPPRVA